MSNSTATAAADDPPTATPALTDTFDARLLTRPAPILLWYYVIIALLTTVGFFGVMPVLFFRYHTLRFKFDDDGISLAWGILFRREIQLTYRRIQDIHVTRNILQRWMGLANVSIQTASGSAGAEMTIEGVLQADALRDFLYKRMRGARGDEDHRANVPEDAIAAPDDEALVLLRQIRDDIRALGSARNHETGGAGEQGS
jgi:putative membrane protein